LQVLETGEKLSSVGHANPIVNYQELTPLLEGHSEAIISRQDLKQLCSGWAIGGVIKNIVHTDDILFAVIISSEAMEDHGRNQRCVSAI